jgi:aminoglycoside phosphotransferase (APT) family kinase protein
MQAANRTRILLEAIRSKFCATSMAPINGGGSSAQLVRMQCRQGPSVVVKFQAREATLVDGHEIAALRRKVHQLRMIRRRLPALAPYCVDVLDEFEQPGAYAMVMPYCDGETLTERLRAGAADGESAIRRLLDVLIQHGYSTQTFTPEPHHFESVHIDRVRRRLGVVMRRIPAVVARFRRFEINGQRTAHATELLRQLESSPELLERLAPAALALPVHGDAVLSNFIWRGPSDGGPEFTAIDPRGTLDAWDPMYDLAKVFFSLSVYDAGVGSGFAVEVSDVGG